MQMAFSMKMYWGSGWRLAAKGEQKAEGKSKKLFKRMINEDIRLNSFLLYPFRLMLFFLILWNFSILASSPYIH
jgi:hypothetical protein